MIEILQNNWFFFLFSLAISLFGGWLIYHYGNELGLIDKPVGRSSHTRATPKGGGISLVVVCVFYLIFSRQNYWLILVCALAIFSFLGDRKEITSFKRFLLQSFCAIGLLIFQRPFFFEYFFWYAGFFLFLIAAINFFNFMDGIDGIAGLNGLVSFLVLAFYAYYYNELEITFFCLLMASALLGFLYWNLSFFGKKIFMGDVGSVFLGTSIAILILSLAQNWLDYFRLCFLLFFFFIDCILTLFVKILRRTPLSQSHRLHLYQVFANENSQPHIIIAFCYALVQVLSIWGAFFYATSLEKLLVFYALLLLAFFLCYIIFRRKIINRFF